MRSSWCLLPCSSFKRAYAARNGDESSEEGDSDEEGIDSELLDNDEDEIMMKVRLILRAYRRR